MKQTSESIWKRETGDVEVAGALAFALSGTNCGVTVQDANFGYHLIYNLPEFWPLLSDNPDDTGIFGTALGEKLLLAKAVLLATGEKQSLTTLAHSRIITFSIDCKIALDGTKLIVTTVQDITHVRRREATMRTLLLELSHRSKNLLAIIQGLAGQSAKHAKSVDGFLKGFMGRLHAVSGSQDLLVDSNWQGAGLFELARRQFAITDFDRDMEVRFIGEDIELDARQALHIGLALHELVMMVVANGAARGTRSISLSVSPGSTPDHISLEWNSFPGVGESGDGEGFGPVLLTRVVPAAVSGLAKLTADAHATSWILEFPLGTPDIMEATEPG